MTDEWQPSSSYCVVCSETGGLKIKDSEDGPILSCDNCFSSWFAKDTKKLKQELKRKSMVNELA